MVRGHYYVYQQATHGGGGSAAAVAMAVVIDIVVTQWCLVLHIVHEQMPLPRLRWRGGGGSAAARCHDLEPRHRRQGSDNCRTTEPATLSKAIVVVVAQRQENLRPSRKAAKACPACTSYHLLSLSLEALTTLIGVWRHNLPFGRFCTTALVAIVHVLAKSRSVGKRRPKVNLSFDAVSSSSADWPALIQD